jgi:hypothetical protein
VQLLDNIMRVVETTLGQGAVPRPASPRTPGPGETRRAVFIEDQLRALAVQMDDCKRHIKKIFDCGSGNPEGEVRSCLIRARDLRYKASLLEAELRRAGPVGEGWAAVPPADDRGPPATDALRQTVHRASTCGMFETRSQQAVFDRASRCLLAPSRKKRSLGIKLLKDINLPPTRRVLKAAMGVGDSETRYEILDALILMKAPGMDSILEETLLDPHHALRLLALRGLFNTESPHLMMGCLRSLADPEAGIRAQAVTFLALQRLRGVIFAIGVMTRDEHDDVRLAAVRGLGVFRSEQTVHTLLRAMGDARVEVRREAMAAVGKTLGVELAIDVSGDRVLLLKEIGMLMQWWTETRAEGRPWSPPVFLSQRETTRHLKKGETSNDKIYGVR